MSSTVGNVDTLNALYDRVRGLYLRIGKTPQATLAIRQEAANVASTLPNLKRALDHARGPAQDQDVRRELLRIQSALRLIFKERLNPLMGSTQAADWNVSEGR